MRYLKLFEAEQDELSSFRETIKMIFVDLIDEGFSVQMLTQQRVKAPGLKHTYQTGVTNRYEKCNVVYVRLVKFRENNDTDDFLFRTFNNKSEDYKYKITDCFNTLLDLLDKRWDGSKLEKIVREDAVTCQDTYFHHLDNKVWMRDFNSISITITKKDI